MTLSSGTRHLGYEQRRLAWLVDLDKWCKKHNLKRYQALSIILKDLTINPELTLKDLFSWVECREFAYDTELKSFTCNNDAISVKEKTIYTWNCKKCNEVNILDYDPCDDNSLFCQKCHTEFKYHNVYYQE